MDSGDQDESSDLILSSPKQFASYIDDTSLDSRRTGGDPVQVAAQVVPDRGIGWFFELLSFFPDYSVELKSTAVLRAFAHLPKRSRQKVEEGLRAVRVHVHDPRTHRVAWEREWERLTGMLFHQDVLRTADSVGEKAARLLVEQQDRFIAKAVLRESAHHRLDRLMGQSPVVHPGRVEATGAADGVEAEMAAFEGERRSLVRSTTEYAVKAAPTFADAMNRLNDPAEFELFFLQSRYGGSHWLAKRIVLEALEEPHAYDRGNEKHLRMVEDARSDLIESLSGPVGLALASHEPGPLASLDSSDSYLVQAADIAAGFARAAYQKEGPVGLVRRFDFVTLNGRRVGVAEAADEMRQHRGLWDES